MRQQSAVALCALLALTSCEPRLDVPAGHNEAQARWEQQRPSDYSFQFQRLCECTYDYMREVRITVSNEEIVDIAFVDDQSQVPREMWNDFNTIGGLFQAIEGAASENAYEIRVTYDADTGYPQNIFIDYDERIADDERIWQISDLQDMTVQPQQAAQLQTPQKVQNRFAETVRGCSLLSSDAGSVGCYRQVVDAGIVEDRLELFWVGSSEPKAALPLFSGQPSTVFDPAAVDDDGIAMANALLRQGGYENIGVVVPDGDEMEYRVRQIDGEIIVTLGQREARAPLPTFDPDLVVSGFRGDPPECLYWLPTQLTVFDREGIAAVRLEPIADWNQDPNSPCYQPLGPDGQPISDEIVGPDIGRTVVMAAGMTWPTSTQSVAPPITSAPPDAEPPPAEPPPAEPPPAEPPPAVPPPAEPPPAEPQTNSAPPPVKAPSREASIATIEKQGGRVRIDTDGGVVAIEMGGDHVTDSALSNLKEIPDATTLYIYNSKVTDAGLANLKGLDQLSSLSLTGSGRVTDAGLVHLKPLPNLKELTLPPTITDAGLVHVGELAGLTSLWITNPQISDAGLLHLQGLKLQYLVLEGTSVSDSGLGHLQTMSDSLLLLRLAGTKITDAGLVHLAGLNALASVGLGYTQVTDTGLKHISGLTGLVNLDLGHTAVTDAGLETLKAISTLRSLNLEGSNVTDAGVEGLKQALPNLSVYRPSPDG